MPKRSPVEQLDLAIGAMLARPQKRPVPRPAASVAKLLTLVRPLRDFPRPEFKASLKRELHRRAFMSEATATPRIPEAADFRPPGFPNIAPYFLVSDGAKFIDFVVSSFEGVERGRFKRPDGTLMHAEITIGDSIVELGEANEQFPARPATTHVYVEDADTAFNRALDAGATSIFFPTSDHPSGDRWGALRDPFGNVWHIATPGGWALGATGMPRSVQPYLHLHDAHKMLPFLESAFNAKATGVHTSPEGKVLHATVEIAGATLEVDEAHGEFQPTPFMLHVYVPDPDTLYAQAIAAGATTIEPPTDKPYGERSAGLKDPFGNLWYVARYTGRPQM
jgi:PhnB protein